MKKIYYVLTALLCVVVSAVFYNCSQEDYLYQDDSRLTTIYSSRSSSTKVYTSNNLESYVSLVQSVEESHPIAVDFCNELEQNGIRKEAINLTSIKRIMGVKSNGVTMLTVNRIGSNDAYVAYRYKDDYCVFYLSRENESYILKTLDGAEFTSYSMSGGKAYLKKSADNETLEAFSNAVYLNRRPKYRKPLIPNTLLTRAEVGEAECCWREKTYDDCFNCTLAGLGMDGGVGIIVGMLAPEIIAAIYISCVGTGPNAPC